nr:MAG TPA: hypothetical protein [Caudoviricetes sp.]
MVRGPTTSATISTPRPPAWRSESTTTRTRRWRGNRRSSACTSAL